MDDNWLKNLDMGTLLDLALQGNKGVQGEGLNRDGFSNGRIQTIVMLPKFLNEQKPCV